MAGIILSGGGINIFGLFSMNPALFCFLLIFIVFGGLNLLEYGRLD